MEPRLILTLSAAPTTAASPRMAPMPASVTRLRVAELGRDLGQAADLDGDAADLERHVGGDDEAGLDGRLARRLLLVRVLGHLVGGDDAVVGGGVVLQQLLEAARAPPRTPATSVDDLGLDVGELLAPAREVADHADERGAEGADAGRDAAAAGRRLLAGGVVEVDLQRFGGVDGGTVAHRVPPRCGGRTARRRRRPPAAEPPERLRGAPAPQAAGAPGSLRQVLRTGR